MLQISDEQFEVLISDAIDELPKEHVRAIKNVAIVYADEPTDRQREELQLQCHQTLFGLYEGVPLSKRAGQTHFPPDKITIFKLPMLQQSFSIAQLKAEVKHTVWHEVAHYFGLNHDQIHRLEQRGFSKSQ